MYDELLNLRKKHKHLSKELEGKFKVLRSDFDEWKHKEPRIILAEPPAQPASKSKSKPHKSDAKKSSDQEKEELTPKSAKAKSSPPPAESSPSERESSKERRRDRKVNKERKSSSEPSIPVIKAPPPPNELTVQEKIMLLRNNLPRLHVGEEVLARWPDDGWYYRSIVKETLGDYEYKVEDSLKDVETLPRDDIISEAHDGANDLFEIGDSVIALHPQYEYSYAPGQIVQI